MAIPNLRIPDSEELRCMFKKFSTVQQDNWRAEEQAMWNRYDRKVERASQIAARKARAEEFRKTKPRKQYREL